ncbi:MAG: NAD+ synthase [Deltaproteobacteria bacterium]|jgi:NAD+ synthase (glutamine-hydrolysing)|nr:NAD+ synthase [Deltaproteobacteria bacterium]
MKIAVSQINVTIGDFAGNTAKIIEQSRWAEKEGADLIVFPELTVCGYPPKDLLEKHSFIKANLEAVEKIAKSSGKTAIIIGYVSVNESSNGRPLFNSVGVLQGGRIKYVQHKTLLPQYDVFDEARYFEPAKKHELVEIAGRKVGLTACEDLWSAHQFAGRRLYHDDPAKVLSEAGADLIINLSASPYTIGKQKLRRKLISEISSNYGVGVVYCNMVGGNDELVFDGRSFITNAKGQMVYEGKAFEEDSFIVDLDNLSEIAEPRDMPRMEEIRATLALGLQDYMHKCGFKKAVIGLSGGIDSAVVAAIACEAIGSRNVTGVLMPSEYSSKDSVEDAKILATNLGMHTSIVPIGEIFNAYKDTLDCSKDPKSVSVVEENLQARIRGNILMAVSNRDGALVLSTGNKSELSVGYCTLYGDMVGGFALISDIPKTMVYELARQINQGSIVIPENTIRKAPSAELRPNQKDQDSLPPYDKLDPIISAYVEERYGVNSIVEMGFERKLVEHIISMIDRNEYKRRQAAPGIKITSKAFGSGRRLPIARKYSEE